MALRYETFSVSNFAVNNFNTSCFVLSDWRLAGTAHTFFSGATDKARSGELINVLREAGQPVPPELLAFGVTTKKKESKLYGAHFREIDMSQKATKIVFDD